MPDNPSLSVFKCPSCGAPLEPEAGTPTMKCPYCGASIVIPESMRTPASASMSLSDVTVLAKQGKLDEAAKIYSRITGLSHEYALISVKSMAGIHDDEPASASPRPATRPQADPYQTPPRVQPTYSQPTVKVRGGSCLSGAIRFIILISILTTAVPALLKALQFKLPIDLPIPTGENPILPVSFAKEVLSFKPGSFQDPRAVGVDGNGNIVVCDFDGGEINVYDPTGNLISSFAVGGSDVYVTSIAVSRDGVIYVPNRKILKFDENGESLGEIGGGSFEYYNHVALGPNDTLYAISGDGIVRFDENDAVDLEISSETLENLTGSPTGFGKISVDGQGNIYFWGNFDPVILKFSPEGEYLSRFGGEDDNPGNFTPGKFVSPHQIAFDGYGRMYVVDFFHIQVFDSNAVYVDRIDKGYYGIAFDAQNNMVATSTLDHAVLKFEIQKPEGAQ